MVESTLSASFLDELFYRQHNYLSSDSEEDAPIYPVLKEEDYLIYDCNNSYKYFLLFGLRTTRKS